MKQRRYYNKVVIAPFWLSSFLFTSCDY